jgi:hypothetical protein
MVNNYLGGEADVNTSCVIPTSGNGISSVDGPENGNLLVDNGGTLTVDAGAILVINSGYSINFSGGGTLLLPAGAQILFNEDMCGVDNDGDGFIEGNNWSYGSYGSCSGVSRANLSGAFSSASCSNPDPGCQASQIVCEGNGYGGETGYCSDGTIDDSASCQAEGDTWTDCNGTWTSGTVNSFNRPTTGDCDDTDANVYPGQTGWFANISNGGTWDYNCDGSVTKEFPTVSNMSCGNDCVYGGDTPPGLVGWFNNGYGYVPSCGFTYSWINYCLHNTPYRCYAASLNSITQTQACQ